jgi:hypothetical protein
VAGASWERRDVADGIKFRLTMFTNQKATSGLGAAGRRAGRGGEVALMLSELFLYLAVISAVVGSVLLLERIVVGPHATAGTGYARVDSAFDFDRLRRKQYGARALSLLRRRRRPSLHLLRELMTHDNRQLRDAGEQFIPVASIVGSVDGASQLFDRSFRPVSDRSRARLGSVLVAMREGEPLPPIDVYAWRGKYYVLDGHHRVAAARAVGSDFISAHVIEVG